MMLVSQVLVLWLQLSQSCKLRYTRKILERKLSNGSRRRAARSNNFDNKNIPGTPGKDYPDYAAIPETSFSCDGRMGGGYYGDPEAGCQVFHVCTNDGADGLRKQSFLCPKGTLFQQKYFVCDWWFNVDCSTTEDFYKLNRAGRLASIAEIDCARGDPVTGRRKGRLVGANNVRGGGYIYKDLAIDGCEKKCFQDTRCKFYVFYYRAAGYDKKSDEGSNSVCMRHENSGASTVVEN